MGPPEVPLAGPDSLGRGVAQGDPERPVVVARLLVEARPYWRWIGGYFLLGLLAVPLTLLTPVPLKVVVDSVLGDSPAPALLGGTG